MKTIFRLETSVLGVKAVLRGRIQNSSREGQESDTAVKLLLGTPVYPIRVSEFKVPTHPRPIQLLSNAFLRRQQIMAQVLGS